jgi:hypothetical protein
LHRSFVGNDSNIVFFSYACNLNTHIGPACINDFLFILTNAASRAAASLSAFTRSVSSRMAVRRTTTSNVFNWGFGSFLGVFRLAFSFSLGFYIQPGNEVFGWERCLLCQLIIDSDDPGLVLGQRSRKHQVSGAVLSMKSDLAVFCLVTSRVSVNC